MPGSEHLFDDLADAVLDGAVVDWAAVESSAGAAAQPFVRDLRLVASVARVYRDVLPPEAPDHWGHLRLLEHVGRGAFGEVFRAWDTRLDREVALKLLPAAPFSDKEAPSSIIREGRLLAKVRHPNVVTIHGAEQIGDRIGLWMEFVRGQTLEQLLQRGTVFRTADVISIGAEVCGAVSAVHAAGLLHRDIKAHNVMRAEDGRIVLMDFGTGRERDDGSPADVAGTPLYLAPELFRAEPATVRSDVYSLGVLLYRLVSGSYPVRGGSVRELRAAHERDTRVPAREAQPTIGVGLARLIDQAIDPRPERRPQTTDELGASLVKIQQHERRKPWLYSAGLAAAAAMVGFTAWALLTPKSPPAPPQTSSAGKSVSADPGPGTTSTIGTSSGATPRTAGAPVPETRSTVAAPPVAPSRVRQKGVRPSVQVLPFVNASGRSGDAWLSAALAEMLLREFRGSESFRWIPGVVPLAKAQLGQALITQSSQFIRPIVPADVVVSGEFSVLGQPSGQPVGIRLTVKLDDKTSGRAATTLSEAGTTTDLIDLVSRIGGGARAALGVPALTESQAKALAASQPANADAARAYAEGLTKTVQEAVELMEQALAADPRFAPAYIALAEGRAFRREPEKVTAAMARAVELSVDLPFEERMLIEIRSLISTGIPTTGPPDPATAARQNARVEAREEIFRKLYGRYPDTLLYGFETARAQERTRQFQNGLATVDVIGRLPGAAEDVNLLELEARLARGTRDHTRAEKALDKAAAVAAPLGDRRLLGEIRTNQSYVARDLGDLTKALWFAEEAAQHFEAIGSPRLSGARQSVATIARDRGDVARARATYEQMIASARAIGSRSIERSTQYNLAYLLVYQGDLSGARAMLEQLIRQGELESLPSDAKHTLALGVVLYRQGQLSASQAQIEQVLADAKRSQSCDCLARYRIARLRFEQGDVEGAREHATKGLQAARAPEGSAQDLAGALGVLARTLLAAGETAAARQAVEGAPPLAGPSRFFRDAAFDVAVVRALVALDEGRWGDGRSAAQQAIALARDDFRPDDEAAGEGVLGLAWLGEGNLVEAQQAITRVEQRLKVTEDRLLHLSGGIAAARVQAASNMPASIALARQRLDALSREADGLGAVAIAFEARLALGEIEIKAGDVATGRARLATLGREAAAKGFVSVASKAAAAAK